MTQNVDDVHSYDTGFVKAMERLEASKISPHNKDLIKDFVRDCRKGGLAKSTTTNYLNLLTRMSTRLLEIGCSKELDSLDQADFDDLLLYLEDIVRLSRGEIRNYKKVLKKLYQMAGDGEIPKWVARLKLERIESMVQPSDLLTQQEVDRLLASCRHPRNRALIAVMLDSGMRVGALASIRVKGIEFNNCGAVIYISKTSRSKKNMAPKGLPITWSTGYLNQWISIHPLKDDPEAPLWTTINEPYQPLSYKTIRATIQNIAENAGIKRRVNPHAFRHRAITSWILDGLSEQEVKHRAGWSRGSTQMFKIYANFTDEEINSRIFEKYGLKTDELRQVILTRCPRCHAVLAPEAKACHQCALILDVGLSKEKELVEEKMQRALLKIMENSEVREMFKEIIEKPE